MKSGWLSRLAGNGALIAAGTIWLLPYAWMTTTSFKSLDEIVRAPTAPWPEQPNLAAYREVFQSVPVGHYLLNTVIMALLIATLQILLALPAGYALAKLHWRGKGAAMSLVLGCLLIPPQVTFVSVFAMLAPLGLINTMTSLVAPFAVSAFGTFLIRQALIAIPDEIVEAARLDGASELRIIFGILAPLLRPTLVAMFLFSFIYHYSDYFWPLVMTTDDVNRTLPMGIALLREQGTGVRWHIVMAGNVILSAPVLLVFLVAQRHIIRAVARSS